MSLSASPLPSVLSSGAAAARSSAQTRAAAAQPESFASQTSWESPNRPPTADRRPTAPVICVPPAVVQIIHLGSCPLGCGHLLWAVSSGQWAVGSGQWAVSSGRYGEHLVARRSYKRRPSQKTGTSLQLSGVRRVAVSGGSPTSHAGRASSPSKAGVFWCLAVGIHQNPGGEFTGLSVEIWIFFKGSAK